jgi:hypothetical protein
MPFLPKDYKIPTSSNYMKFVDGKNKFRILSDAIVGLEYWTEDRKPVRLHEMPTETPKDIGYDNDGKVNQIKPFWAFIVWNYNDKRIQILEITQKSIMQNLQSLADDGDWGNPTAYDVTVNRKGDGLNTEYSVMPNPTSKLSKEAMDAYEATKINLEALFGGLDPFTGEKPVNSGKMKPAYDKENYPKEIDADVIAF